MKSSDPTRIGRYEIVTMLGEGGMARVYLAVNRGPIGFNKLVVVKQVRPELAWDRDFVTMFFDEARIAARLNHPNVVQTYEVIEDTGQFLLAMEFLEGQTLSDLLRRVGRANMPLEEHLWILTQVLTGLHYAHDLRDYDGTPLGVVHRDVSPSNVFITYNGEVKLLDFGIAKAAGAISATQKGMVKGKIAYGAPEQFSGEHVDRRADIFSVGIMLWEALARKRRKLAETSAASFQALLGGANVKIREVDPGVSAALADICDRAVATDPVERYATAAEFQIELENYLEKHMRRVERREVATLMGEHFKSDRAEMGKRIEEQVGALRTAPSVEPGASHSSRAPTVIDLLRNKAGPGSSADATGSRPWGLPNRRLVLGASTVAILGIVAIGSSVRSGRSPSIPVQVPVVVAAALPSAAEARPAPQAVPVEQPRVPETVRVGIKVEPSSAMVLLDGKKLAVNNFQTDFQRELKGSHVLRVTAPGYFPVERTISFARDLNLIITLRPMPPPPRTAKRADDSDSTPAARTETKGVEPGADLQRQEGPRSGRHIDEKDPYGK